ncbi:acyl carrier protein-like protein [Phascolomyces articulosus]|uniref:Acyl carrier protein n=1 Tax=Phascolomyces articulosus TaxID=60185 RepID=A0AAD5K918_9FUNG|nr:acyl carrier protein-like protein [Phascolomyces articulosus]
MFRPTVLLNAASRVAAVRAPVARVAAPAVFTRLYSAGHSADIESRILDILRGFDKIDESKVSLDAHFVNDLGLDSLDTVEVIMAVEEEFSVEITDKDADEIKTAKQAVEYISKRPDAH